MTLVVDSVSFLHQMMFANKKTLQDAAQEIVLLDTKSIRLTLRRHRRIPGLLILKTRAPDTFCFQVRRNLITDCGGKTF